VEHIEFSWRTSDGLDMYGQGWLPETETRGVVCLVHGLGEHSGRYAHVGAVLTNACYALLSFDLRGHGRSGGARGHSISYDALMDDIAHLLDEAKARYPGLPCFLYGHSLGGGLALNYALRRKPKLAGVVASGPWLRLAFEPPKIQISLARMMNRVYPAFSQANGLDVRGLSHDPQVVRDYVQDPLVHNKITARLAIVMLDAGQWALEHAAEFSLPLLLVHGGADRLTSALGSREFAQKVRGDCTLKIWDGLYHETHNEPQKDEVLTYITAWLQSHTRPAGQTKGKSARKDAGHKHAGRTQLAAKNKKARH
jgi:alpha-beta hydrolase superfamily lysophospholipase